MDVDDVDKTQRMSTENLELSLKKCKYHDYPMHMPVEVQNPGNVDVMNLGTRDSSSNLSTSTSNIVVEDRPTRCVAFRCMV
jgi:hypothetical protein